MKHLIVLLFVHQYDKLFSINYHIMSYHKIQLYNLVTIDDHRYKVEGLLYKGPENTLSWRPHPNFPKTDSENRYYLLVGVGFDHSYHVCETKLLSI